jgi:hypothetical protein
VTPPACRWCRATLPEPVGEALVCPGCGSPWEVPPAPLHHHPALPRPRWRSAVLFLALLAFAAACIWFLAYDPGRQRP